MTGHRPNRTVQTVPLNRLKPSGTAVVRPTTKKQKRPLVTTVEGHHWTVNGDVHLTVAVGTEKDARLPEGLEAELERHAAEIARYIDGSEQ